MDGVEGWKVEGKTKVSTSSTKLYYLYLELEEGEWIKIFRLLVRVSLWIQTLRVRNGVFVSLCDPEKNKLVPIMFLCERFYFITCQPTTIRLYAAGKKKRKPSLRIIPVGSCVNTEYLDTVYSEKRIPRFIWRFMFRTTVVRKTITGRRKESSRIRIEIFKKQI